MNPFTEPTVADPQPLTRRAWRGGATAPPVPPPVPAQAGRPHRVDPPKAGPARRSAARAWVAAGTLTLAAWSPHSAVPLGAVALAAAALPASAFALDLNRADLEQLQGIKGIGPRTAQNILDERVRGGPYLSFDDLSDRVKGIGQKRAATLQSAGLRIGPAPQETGRPEPAKRPAATPLRAGR